MSDEESVPSLRSETSESVACAEDFDYSSGDAASQPSISDSEAEMPVEDELDSRFWRPGENCGTFVDRHAALQGQGQVLSVNVMTNLQRCPRDVLSAVMKYMPVRPGLPNRIYSLVYYYFIILVELL